MKTKHWILVVLASIIGLASTASSVWLKMNKAQAYYVPAGSMDPTLPIGARVIGWMNAYDSAPPKRGDIALVELPLSLVAPEMGSGTTTFVKRVVGVPGDRVEIVKSTLKVNGQVQKEPFAKWEGGYYYDMKVVNGQVYSREYDLSGVPGNWTHQCSLVDEEKQRSISHAKAGALPPDKFLVLGDNRSNSNDSHVFGPIPRSTFKGKVGLQYWPRVRSF